MARYIVSFCNLGRTRLAIIRDATIEHCIELDLSGAGVHVAGITGIAFHHAHCILAMQSNPAVLVALDHTLTVEMIYPVDDAVDIHGIASYQDEIVIASTGTNQVLAFDPRTRDPRVLWTAGESLSDTVHVNDLAVFDGEIVCSQFGVRTAQAMRCGEVVEIATNTRVATHLREPHSVATDGNALFVLESATGDLLRLRPDFAPARILGASGYLRGLAVNNTHYAIGKSGYRRDSRHRVGDSRLAPLTPSSGADDALHMSGVFIVDRASFAHDFVDTTAIGPEIY